MSKMGRPRVPVVDRFWVKVNKTETCWLWSAAKTEKGYGMFGTDPSTRVTTAHRFSYELHVGEIPAGYQIDHLCRTPACVNPDHLEAVTRWENLNRSRRARLASLAEWAS